MQPPKIREEGGVLILTLDDPAVVNDGMATDFRQPIYESMLDRPEARVAVDLGVIDYLSSSGVALLIGIKRRIDQVRGTLVLFQIHPDVLDLLRSMKLLALFRVAATQGEALEILSSAPDA